MICCWWSPVVCWFVRFVRRWVLQDETTDEELLKLSSDLAVFKDEGFRPFAEKFRDSQDAFFEAYAKAHKQLSELGSKFEPEQGIELDY